MTAEFYDEQGHRVAVGSALGRGGEGEVFDAVGRSDVAIKILYPARRLKAKHDKVAAMVARPPAGAYDETEGLPVLTWPRAVLYSSAARRDASTFMGYSMVRVPRRDFVPFYQLTSSTRRQALGGVPITWDRLLLLGIRLCHVVRTLHAFGYAVGDMNDRNVLVSRKFTPLFMDTDSFQVPKPHGGHFPSIVGDQMFWAPELLDVDFTTFSGTRTFGDRYALGILLFQLMMNGLRPYQARGSAVDDLETLVDKTRAGSYPWSKPRRGILEPPVGAPDYGALPRPIRATFERCFVDGHRKPKRRPTPEEWYQTLLKVHEAGTRTCDVEASHVYANEFRSCPWCKDPNDPFTPPPKRRRPPPARARRKATPNPAASQPSASTASTRRPASRYATPPQQPLPPPPSASTASTPAKTHRSATRQNAYPADDVDHGLVAARAAWIAVLVAAYATPTAVLTFFPHEIERMAVTVAFTALFVAGGGVLVTWRWVRPAPGPRAVAVGIWLAVAMAAAAVLALSGRWTWLVATTGVGSLGLGLAGFVAMERRGGATYQPDGRGLLNGVVGLVVAYFPVALIAAWRLAL